MNQDEDVNIFDSADGRMTRIGAGQARVWVDGDDLLMLFEIVAHIRGEGLCDSEPLCGWLNRAEQQIEIGTECYHSLVLLSMMLGNPSNRCESNFADRS